MLGPADCTTHVRRTRPSGPQVAGASDARCARKLAARATRQLRLMRATRGSRHWPHPSGQGRRPASARAQGPTHNPTGPPRAMPLVHHQTTWLPCRQAATCIRHRCRMAVRRPMWAIRHQCRRHHPLRRLCRLTMPHRCRRRIYGLMPQRQPAPSTASSPPPSMQSRRRLRSGGVWSAPAPRSRIICPLWAKNSTTPTCTPWRT